MERRAVCAVRSWTTAADGVQPARHLLYGPTNDNGVLLGRLRSLLTAGGSRALIATRELDAEAQALTRAIQRSTRCLQPLLR